MRLKRCAVALTTGVLLSAGHGETQERPRFSDVAGTETLVYPDGPNITVENHRAASVEIWVVRLLDGAVVRRYTPPQSKDSTWKESIQVDASGKNDDLGARVKGMTVPLTFALFLLGSDREVQDILRFVVRVNAGREAPTLPMVARPFDRSKQYAFMSSGTLHAIKSDGVVVRTPHGDELFKTPANDTKVFEAGGKFGAWTWGGATDTYWKGGKHGTFAAYDPKVFWPGGTFGEWTWAEAKDDLHVGDQVSVIYSSKTDADKVALQVVVASPPSVPTSTPSVDPLPKLRFQVGTVVSAKEVTEPPKAMPGKPQTREMIVETKNGNRRWRIRESTKIARGAVAGERSDLSSNTLVAVGAPEFQKGEVVAAHVLLLIDLTDQGTR